LAQANLQLACCLYFHQPAGRSPEFLEDTFDSCYEPVLEALESDPRLRLNLHFSGNVLEFALARRPAFLDRLARLWRDGQAEVLGGAFYAPVLGSIPERDAVGQLQYTASFYKSHLGRVARGAWLSLRAWDSSLPTVLAGAGLSYTLLDAGHFVSAGCLPESLDGYYTTERAGRSLGLFPLNAELATWVGEGTELLPRLEGLAQHGRGEEAFHVFALEGHALLRSGGLGALHDVLKGQSHWLKSELLQSLFERHSSRGRVYLPACAYPRIARWLKPAAAGRRYREISEVLEEMGALEETRPMLGSMLWDNVLVKYPEANRLQKRMLRVSHRIDLLRTAVQASANKGEGPELDRARELVKRCCTALWRAQGHATYWHGLGALPGIYDPRSRYLAQRHLLSIDRMVDSLLKDPCQENWTFRRADYDADGSDELLVRTPHFSALLHPGRGGGLWELDLRAALIPLQTSLTPVHEPELPRLEGNEVALVFDDEAEVGGWEVADSAPLSAASNGASARRRGAFLDRFLGPETTPQNFAMRQFRELGNFAGLPYEVLPVIRPEGAGQAGRIILGRSGVVKDVSSTDLLRIEKSYCFEVANPRLGLGVEILNRSRDAARVWYGLEWTFGIPSGEAEQLLVKTISAADEEQEFQLADQCVDLGEITCLEWQDPASDLAIVLTFARPMAVWWLRIDSDYEAEDGRRSTVQGNTLLVHDKLEIWGGETHKIEMQVDFLKGTA